MNIIQSPESKQWIPDTSEDDVARKYYENRMKRAQKKLGLSSYLWPQYGSVLRTIERFSLVTHLIFLYKRRKLTKKEYEQFSLQWNLSIVSTLQRRGLISQLDL